MTDTPVESAGRPQDDGLALTPSEWREAMLSTVEDFVAEREEPS